MPARRFFRLLWFRTALVLLAASLPLAADVAGTLSKLTNQEAAAVEQPDEAATRLEQWLKEARLALVRINEPGTETRLPLGIEPAALADYRRDLEQIILSIGRQQKTVGSAQEAHKALEVARVAAAAWTGFTEKPPYSILMIDELVNQQDAITEKATSCRSSLELFGRSLSNIQEEGRQAEEAGKRVLAEAEKDPSDDGAAKWRLTADRTKSRSLALRATFLQSTIAMLQEQAETAKVQISLLDRQITIAKKQPGFSVEDLAKVKKAAADRQAALKKEIVAIRKKQQEATAVRIKAQSAVDLLLKPAPENPQTVPTPALALASVKLEAAETRVEVLQYVAETLESLDQLESYGPEAYQNRSTLMTITAKTTRESALQALRSAQDRLKSWEIVVANDFAAVNADISKQESRATSIAAEDPLLLPINDLRAALWDKQAVVQRVSQSVSTQRRLLQRWLDDYDLTQVGKPLSESVTDAATSIWQSIMRIWAFEVFQYDDTVMIGGLPITEKRGVALGRFFSATVFFLVAYFITRRLNNRLRNVVVRRGHIAEAQATTLSNWMMLVVGFLLAIATLHFLKIPLTVFAFFGGALAIGLGFGTQTLIKNFISGIIVLFERKIRVGDIVDIGGGAGTITEINTRSSVLRGADGKETLVPNSLFLENHVTNLTLSNRRVRRMLTVRVALGTAPQSVSTILKECVDRHGLILEEPAPIITFDDFAENAYVFAIYYWTEFNDKTNADVVASDLRFMIEKQFVEAGIHFPAAKPDFPFRTEQPLLIEWVKKAKGSPA